MKELSVFVDESGDFGEYEKHAPYYIITMILHDQSVDISAEISKLNEALMYMGYGNEQSIHTEPLIRREDLGALPIVETGWTQEARCYMDCFL